MQSSGKLDVVKVGRALVYLVYFFVLLCLAILVMGFFLLLFGANPEASFAEWVYRALDRVMKPFRGIFQSIQLNGQSVLDVSVVFAMIVYGIVALVLRALINWLTYRIVLLERQTAGPAPPAAMPATAYRPAAPPAANPAPQSYGMPPE
jgi:uncharacterized protein YggT (Ycf19 family)